MTPLVAFWPDLNVSAGEALIVLGSRVLPAAASPSALIPSTLTSPLTIVYSILYRMQKRCSSIQEK